MDAHSRSRGWARPFLVVGVAVLPVAAIALALRLNSMSAALGEQQQQIRSLKTALADNSNQRAFAAQAQCSEMVGKFLSSRGYKGGKGDTYVSHFNSKLNKCFVLVTGVALNADFVMIDLYDAVEGKRYATYNGHSLCDAAFTNPRKCAMDSGHIWFDGDDSRLPADFTVGFRGLLYGGGAGDENTQKTFLARIRPFMTE